MKVITYMCENCFEPHIFKFDDKRDEYICPKCGEKMMYWSTEEIDPITNKVINRSEDEYRKTQSPGKPISSEFSHLIKPSVKCSYCGSTNVKRISTTAKVINIAMFGLLGNKRKYQWHCNSCNSDF